ncbi:predicted protein [Nematostella vectensis]|uniref:EF-hand domain-containing protein n=1 Tax=Nematostella vectensis TaxID=45351 RepID=A7S7Z1_NEMVE|nr:predicted protein [Nematostella vectensis]|eukprot:XP_001632268.1 predicted protein [Nematostella vectensis]
MGLFVSYDTNADGRLDPYEFVPVAHRILGQKVSLSEKQAVVHQNWDDSGEHLTMKALFKPLELSTMTKTSDSYFLSDSALTGLKSWKVVSIPSMTLPVNAFAAFLPPSHASTGMLGTPWFIVEPQIAKFSPQLSSNRYNPPDVSGNNAVIHQLLAMFHPRPFIFTRFGPQGTAACIEAQNNEYLAIQFRIHAEFQLNEPPLHPFWFSPAQFAGRLVISRDGKHIASFHMGVPTNKSLNVENDASETTSSNMEVDIGFLPQMEIVDQGESCSVTAGGCDSGTSGKHSDNIEWNDQIPNWAAEKKLEQHFYPFKKVDYLPFKEAFNRAKAEKKLVHHIVLWGALDDQSLFLFIYCWMISGSGRTLREGPLESRPVLQLLQDNYVNCWSLVEELKKISKDGSDQEMANIAQISLDNYRFPVESMVMHANGSLVARMNANEMMEVPEHDSLPKKIVE